MLHIFPALSSFLGRKQNQVCAECFWLSKGFGVQLGPLIKLLLEDYLRSFYFLVVAEDWGQEEIADLPKTERKKPTHSHSVICCKFLC